MGVQGVEATLISAGDEKTLEMLMKRNHNVWKLLRVFFLEERVAVFLLKAWIK